MATAYIPRPDGSFDAWQANFVAYVAGHWSELGLPSSTVTTLNVASIDWGKKYEEHVAARAAAASARTLKDANRADFDKLIREVAQRIQGFPNTSDAHRAGLGITVRDAVPTPVGPPTTRPLVRVDFSKRLQHRIAYSDEATPTRRAKPSGVMGAEVWVNIAAPASPRPPIRRNFVSCY